MKFLILISGFSFLFSSLYSCPTKIELITLKNNDLLDLKEIFIAGDDLIELLTFLRTPDFKEIKKINLNLMNSNDQQLADFFINIYYDLTRKLIEIEEIKIYNFFYFSNLTKKSIEQIRDTHNISLKYDKIFFIQNNFLDIKDDVGQNNQENLFDEEVINTALYLLETSQKSTQDHQIINDKQNNEENQINANLAIKNQGSLEQSKKLNQDSETTSQEDCLRSPIIENESEKRTSYSNHIIKILSFFIPSSSI